MITKNEAAILISITVLVLALAAQDAIIAVAPWLVYGLAAMIILAALATTGGYVLTHWAEVAGRWHELRNTVRRARLEEDRARFELAQRSELWNVALDQARRGIIAPQQIEGHQFRPLATSAQPLLEAGPVRSVAEPPILPVLEDRQRILLAGPSDSGKTTLLRWLIDVKRNCLIIDPHGSPPKWGATRHIGAGRDYRAIGVVLEELIREMNRRYGQIASGEVLEGKHPHLTIVIDEWRAIINNVDRAGDQIKTLLTEARKANLDLIVSTHSKLVKALGVEGEGDLRKGFVVCNLYGGNGEPRRATLEFNGDGKELPHALPGAYPDRGFVNQIGPPQTESILDLDVVPDPDEILNRVAIESYQKHGSYSQAFRDLYRAEHGVPYKGALGGHQTAKIKAILDEGGVSHPVRRL